MNARSTSPTVATAAARIELRAHADGEPIQPVQALMREYATALDIDLAFQGFDQELAELPGAYAPPDGILRLAWADRALAGCGAIRRLSLPGEADAAELKRLFVRPAYRGLGLGRRLAETLVDDARCLGYTTVRLDTLASMASARRLYGALGFVETPPYYPNSVPGTRFLMLRSAPLEPTRG